LASSSFWSSASRPKSEAYSSIFRSIVAISSSYSGIFKETKMLVLMKKYLKEFSKRTSNYNGI